MKKYIAIVSIIICITFMSTPSLAKSLDKYSYDDGDIKAYEFATEENFQLTHFNRFEIDSNENLTKVKFYSKKLGLNFKLYFISDFDEKMKILSANDYFGKNKIKDYEIYNGTTDTNGWIEIGLKDKIQLKENSVIGIGISFDKSNADEQVVPVCKMGQAKKGKTYYTDINSMDFLTDTSEASYNIGYLALRAIVEPQEEEVITKPLDKGFAVSFDAREKNWTTPVKDQEHSGPCWAFAALGATEHTWKKSTGEDIDLSENHMMHHHGYYENLIDNDTQDDLNLDQLKVKQGGTFGMAINYLVNWKGAVDEKKDAYDSSFKTIRDVEEKLVHVQDIAFIEDRNRIDMKQAILDYGSISSSMYIDCHNLDEYENLETGSCYYDIKGKNFNHQILIVGWDDSYKKENFRKTPSQDGAWIVKNSGGQSEGDSGYKYVSYDDLYIGHNMFAIKKVEDNKNYDNMYDHEEYGYTSKKSSWGDVDSDLDGYFNRFITKSDESLEAIGFYTLGKNTSYKLYVIPEFDKLRSELSFDEYETTIDNYLVKNGTIESAGYHTIKLDKAIDLIKNKDFAIGIHLETEGIDDPYAFESRDWEHGRFNSNTNNLETFFPDSFGDSFLSDLNPFPKNKSTYGNVCLKAYTKNKSVESNNSETTSSKVMLEASSTRLKPGEEFVLTVKIKDADQVAAIDSTISYDESIFKKVRHEIVLDSVIEYDGMIKEDSGELSLLFPLKTPIKGNDSVSLMNIYFEVEDKSDAESGSLECSYMGIGKRDGSFGFSKSLPSSIITVVSGGTAKPEQVKVYIEEVEKWLPNVVVGEAHGQYPKEKMDAYKAQFELAKQKMANNDMSEQEVDNLLYQLKQLESELRLSRVIDINNNNGADLGDLAWGTGYYNENADESQNAKILDLNNNGQVDAFDLSVISNRFTRNK